VQDEGTIVGLDNLKNYITTYYKNLFGAPKEGNFFMDKSQTDDIPQVSIEKNNLLTAEYLEEEVRKDIFQMKHNKAPGPDSFPVEFYQTFWDTIKGDLLDLLAVFMLDN
jgi:hypothetical protein